MVQCACLKEAGQYAATRQDACMDEEACECVFVRRRVCPEEACVFVPMLHGASCVFMKKACECAATRQDVRMEEEACECVSIRQGRACDKQSICDECLALHVFDDASNGAALDIL